MIPTAQVRGDHYVTVKVAIPREISAEERKLLVELQAKGGGGSGSGEAKEGKKAKGGKVRRVSVPRSAS